MSLRTEVRWSLATRLTVWFTVAFGLAFSAAITVTHVAILRAADQQPEEDVQNLAVRIHTHRAEFVLLAKDDTIVSRIVDPYGNVYFEKSGAIHFPAAAFPSSGGRASRAALDGHRVQLTTCIVEGWTYHFIIDPVDEQDPTGPIYRGIASVVGPILAVAVAVSYLVVRAGLRPLRRLKSAVREIGPDQLDRRLPLTGLPPELRELSTTFNLTLERLSSTFARLDQFAADVAHEIRTPIHNIRAMADLGLAADGPADDTRARVLAEVIEEAGRITRLVDRLLILARVTDPRAGLAGEIVDIGGELTAIHDFFGPSAEDTAVSLATSCTPGLTAQVDRTLFVRAVSNLVSNALAATSAGGQVWIRGAGDAAGFVVEVLDTGRGIRPESFPHLFDRYYRPPGADRGHGIGLGLAIVKRVVELHGGSVSVASTPGSGSTFRLLFPRWKNSSVSSG